MYKSSRQELLYNNISCNNSVIISLSKHIENLGTGYFIQAFSGTFRDIQPYPVMFRHIEGH